MKNLEKLGKLEILESGSSKAEPVLARWLHLGAQQQQHRQRAQSKPLAAKREISLP